MYLIIRSGERVIVPRDGEARRSKFKTGSNPRRYSSSLTPRVKSTSIDSASFTVNVALSAYGQSLIGLTVTVTFAVELNPSSSVTL